MISIRQYQMTVSNRTNLENFVREIDQQGLNERDAWPYITDWCASLPAELQQALLRFQYDRNCDALHLRGIPIGEVVTLPTPLNHDRAQHYPVYGFQAICLAISRMLGYAIGFSTQQHGRICNDIVPIRSDENTPNISSGYRYDFDFHNEDAFMMYPPDFFQLSCVRNPTNTPLTISGIDAGNLPASIEERLRRPHFLISPNVVQAGWGAQAAASPVISGPPDHPYIRYNGPSTAVVDGDMQSLSAALDALEETLSKNAQNIEMMSGDVAIVKNHRLCHARRAYPAKCDGTDRWMVRLIIFRSLRLVDAFMSNADFPVIEPI
jgi:L-asparagine oxygenase